MEDRKTNAYSFPKTFPTVGSYFCETICVQDQNYTSYTRNYQLECVASQLRIVI